jgi:hypothetical protein
MSAYGIHAAIYAIRRPYMAFYDLSFANYSPNPYGAHHGHNQLSVCGAHRMIVK